MPDEDLRTLIREEFGVRNGDYLDRICEVSRGNPRIAVMAARVAIRENTLASLSDVSALYDEYFQSVREDIADLGDANLLKAAGILAFFRALDRQNDDLMRRIGAAFDIAPGELWDAIRRLHELEAVDLYQGEVAKVSDQVLATYLFYVAAFERGVLDLTKHLASVSLQYRLPTIGV